MIIATAGHVDHGKSALIKALTGVDTDRLPEEKSRGLSIDLGYAYWDGDDGRVLGFVDVPGHERFLTNMLAGLSGIDAALLVVAADDGPMPQTHEHLAILDLLAVSQAVVAITKCDRVAPEDLVRVEAAVRALLVGTTLAAAPVHPTSVATGLGLTALAGALWAMAPRPHRSDEEFRLAVDRVFVLRGIGRVATGTVLSGQVAVGDRLTVSPAGREVRVRGLHAQNRPVVRAGAGVRCALNLVGDGAARDLLRRGHWLVSAGRAVATRRLDVRLRPAVTETAPLRRDQAVQCHIGTGAIPGRAVLLDARARGAAAEAWAQILLDRPVDAVAGDRFILRDGPARRTLAGGRVVTPFGAARGRAKPARMIWLGAMAAEDPREALGRLVRETGAPVDLTAFRRARNLDQAALAVICEGPGMVRAETRTGPFAVSKATWAAWRGEALGLIEVCHAEAAERLGLGRDELRRGLTRPSPPPGLLAAVLAELVEQGALVFRLGVYHRPGHAPSLSGEDEARWRQVEAQLRQAGARSPVVHQLAAALGFDPESLRGLLVRAARLGLSVQIARNRFVLPAGLRTLALHLECWPKAADGFSVSAFRDRAAIGRNLAIEVLEFFDARGLTRRDGDTRRLVGSVELVFGKL